MTTSRVIRGTKAKILLYFIAIVLVTLLIACFNNTLSQLDDVKKSNEICHQQEENLSTQLQVISDYKQRLEKSLKIEKAEHQQTKTNSENKFNEEKIKTEKANNDAKLKFNSLQQHYNLLQTQYDDFKEESSKIQEKQLNEINDLQAKLKEVQEQIKKIQSVKESLKTQYLELQVVKENLEQQLKGNSNLKSETESKVNHLLKQNHELQREVNALKEKCTTYETIHEPPQERDNKKNEASTSKNQVQSPENKNAQKDQLQERNVLAAPSGSENKLSSTKSTTVSGLRVSKAKLNGARPLGLPTVTPETLSRNHVVFGLPKLPQGVVPIPEKQSNELHQQNDQANEPVNNRYRNKIEKNQPKEEIDKENGAHEVFDVPVQNGGAGSYDGLVFGDKNDVLKQADKQSFNNKQHIDMLGVADRKAYDQDQPDYKEIPNDVQMEENEPEEDDDADEYGDHLGRPKDPAVRN